MAATRAETQAGPAARGSSARSRGHDRRTVHSSRDAPRRGLRRRCPVRLRPDPEPHGGGRRQRRADRRGERPRASPIRPAIPSTRSWATLFALPPDRVRSRGGSTSCRPSATRPPPALLCHGVSRWTKSPWAGAPLGRALRLLAAGVALRRLGRGLSAEQPVRGGARRPVGRRPRSPRPFLLPLTAFVVGLGLTNHHTLIFLGAPLVVALVLARGEGRLSTTSRRHRPGSFGRRSAALRLPPPRRGRASSPRLGGSDTGRASSPISCGGSTAPSASRTPRWGSGRDGPSPDRALPAAIRARRRSGQVRCWPRRPAPQVRRPSPSRRLVLFWSATLAFYLVVFSTLANVRLDEPAPRHGAGALLATGLGRGVRTGGRRPRDAGAARRTRRRRGRGGPRPRRGGGLDGDGLRTERPPGAPPVPRLRRGRPRVPAAPRDPPDHERRGNR